MRSLLGTHLLVLFTVSVWLPFVATGSRASAQDLNYIQWQGDGTSHDFGNVLEQDSIVYHTYWFRNTSGQPIKLNYVKAGCGCTTPLETRRIIAPGDTGSIITGFTAWRRPGAFQKAVTVHISPASNLDADGNALDDAKVQKVQLTFNGNVVPRPPTIEDVYPVTDGALRLTAAVFNIGSITSAETRSLTIGVWNPTTNTQTIRLTGLESPGSFAKLEFVDPSRTALRPGDSTRIRVTFNAAAANDYDFVNYQAFVQTDDNNNPKKTLHITAQILEDFSRLTPEERANAPHAQLSNMQHDFGSVARGPVHTGTLTLTNTGQRPLVIRKLKTQDTSVLNASISKMTLAPGEVATLTFQFNSAQWPRAVFSKVVTLITNDPAQPVQRMSIRGTLPAPESGSNNGLPPGHFHGDGHDHSGHNH